MKHHAFIDESVRPGRYLLTAALVPSHELTVVTRQVKELFPRGNRRTHLSAESKQRRRQLLKAYAQVSTSARIVVAAYEGGDDQLAREACLDAIVSRAREWELGMLVLDSRGPHRDALDRRFIAQTLRDVPGIGLQYTHRGSRDEVLLSLPDAVGWAVGAGGPWRELVDPIVAEVLELGP
jgi:hypothetical protein